MRRLISFLLLIALSACGLAWVWMQQDLVKEHLEAWWTIEEKTWVEKPVTKVDIGLAGGDMLALDPVSRKIASFLTPFDGRLKVISFDTPTARITISAALPASAVIPMRELTRKMVGEPSVSRGKSSPASRPARKIRHAPRQARRLQANPAAKKIQDVRRRKEILMKTWRDAEQAHARAAAARKQFRHPEELLKDDAEARELKQKLIDLEMTMAEVIDHYTLAHPRVKDLQNDISAVRSSLDRRVMIAETEEESAWERRQAAFQQKKRLLEREEKQYGKGERVHLPASLAPAEPADAPDAESERNPPAPESTILTWAETETVVRELRTEKRLDPGKLAMGIMVLSASAILLGYLCGLLGGFGASGGSRMDAASSESAASDPMAALANRETPKPRKPLPPIVATPAPPVPEKIIEESELPGEAWVTLPALPKVEKGLYTVFAPTSPASDFFSKTAENLLSKLPKSDRTQVVSVAAIRSGTGTSTFTANLAVSILARRPVLLIDLHHTAPSLHGFFSINTTAQDITSSGPWAQSVVPTPLDRLFLLPLFSPHLDKEMSDLKVKKRLHAFLKENPPNRLVLMDIAPIGRSELFEEVAEVSDLFMLILGPDPAPASDKSALKRLSKAMKRNPILRVTRTAEEMPGALVSRPPAQYEFSGRPASETPA